MILKTAISLLALLPSVSGGFAIAPAFVKRDFHTTTVLCVSEKEDLGKQAASLLGNLADAVADKAKEEINKLTDKDEYEFGDLIKWVDTRARTAVSELTEKEQDDLGDLTQWVEGRLKNSRAQEWLGGRIKELQSNEDVTSIVDNLKELGSSDDVTRQLEVIVGKDTTDKLKDMMAGDEIELGEIGQTVGTEILDLLKAREYTVADFILLFKILSAVGLSLNPVIVSAFPLNLLLQAYNAALVSEVSSHIVGALALEIDNRAKKAFTVELERKTKEALTGDPEANVGSVVKNAILEYTGKESYDFGDVTRMLQSALDGKTSTDLEELKIGASPESSDALIPELAKDAEVFQEAIEVEAQTEAEPEAAA